MAVYRRPSRTRYVLALLVLASLTLVTLDARGNDAVGKIRGDARSVLNPVANATHDALAPIGNFFTGAADYGSLKKENNRLRAQIAGMQANASVTQSALAEASQELAQQKLPFATNVNKVTAAVIGRNPGNFDVDLVINKGTGQGMAPGYPVVTQAGLVGTVLSATKNEATVRVLTDPDFTVGVTVAPGVTGEAHGYGPANPLQVIVSGQSTPVTRGTILTTSGVALESYPRGIPVGRVTSVATAPGALQETVSLAPLISANQLLVVSVLLYSGQTP